MDNIKVINKVNGAGEIEIIGDIGSSFWGAGYSFDDFKKDIEAIQGPITVNIKSFGGDLFEAYSIHDYLRTVKSKVTTKVIGSSASAATVISMAGDVRLISRNSKYLIHKPMVGAMGNSDDFEEVLKQLKDLDKDLIDLYVSRSNLDAKQVLSLMRENKFISAEQALEHGFVDGIIEEKSVSNNQNIQKMEKILNLLNVKTEDEVLAVVNSYRADISQFTNKEKDKDEEIENLKARIAELEEELKNIDEEKAENLKNEVEKELDEAEKTGKVKSEARNYLAGIGIEQGLGALKTVLNAIAEPKPANVSGVVATPVINNSQPTNPLADFKAGKINLQEYMNLTKK
jgi:ATP-dependent Clp protease, protease subunit